MENPTTIEAGDAVVVIKDRGLPLPHPHVVSKNTVACVPEDSDPSGVIRFEDGESVEVWGDECYMNAPDEGHRTEQVIVAVDDGSSIELDASKLRD